MIPSALSTFKTSRTATGQLRRFLDYDGTLTPIVSHPEKALLSDSMRQAVQALATHASVAILSGRDLDDIRQRVNIGTIVYAGSHGFDIAGPRGLRKARWRRSFLPSAGHGRNGASANSSLASPARTWSENVSPSLRITGT